MALPEVKLRRLIDRLYEGLSAYHLDAQVAATPIASTAAPAKGASRTELFYDEVMAQVMGNTPNRGISYGRPLVSLRSPRRLDAAA